MVIERRCAAPLDNLVAFWRQTARIMVATEQLSCNHRLKLQPTSAENDWIPPGFHRGLGSDFVADDGKTAIELKLGSQGLRDFHGAIVQAGLHVRRDPRLEQVIVVVRFPRMTLASIRDAWTSAKEVLDPKIARRLGVVALLPDEPRVWCEPATAQMGELARLFAERYGGHSKARVEPAIPSSRKFFEVWKVLLLAWLKRSGPMSAKEISTRAMCSYPLVLRFIAFLRDRHELVGDAGKLELRGFPRATFQQAVGLADGLRRTTWFVDATKRHAPDLLVRRLRRARLKDVAVGGVYAARALDSDFDLHGTPRLDLTQWTRRSFGSIAFVSKLDSALRVSPTKDDAVLALHRLVRARPMFESDDEIGAIADPVEVLLDLHELRLEAQADALVKRLRGES
jgi:hypothetical protein